MNSECQSMWLSLLTDAVNKAWINERNEIRKLAMLVCAFHEELDRVKSTVNLQLQQLKNEFDMTDVYKQTSSEKSIQKIDVNRSLKEKENFNPELSKSTLKENLKDNAQSPDIFNQTDFDDFNFFKNKPLKEKNLNLKEDSEDFPEVGRSDPVESCSPSLPESPSKMSTSPKINRTLRFSRPKRQKLCIANIMDTKSNDDNSTVISIPKVQDSTSISPERMNSILIEFNSPDEAKGKLHKKLDILEGSIIDGTPESNRTVQESKRRKRDSYKAKHLMKIKHYKNKKPKLSTLTQIFGVTSLNSNQPDTNKEPNKDVVPPLQHNNEETYVEVPKSSVPIAIKEEQEENNASLSMGITEIINNINKTPPKESYDTFVKDYDRIPDNNPSSPSYAHQSDPVRGKKRLNLKGWSCQDCKKYYEALDLPEDKLKEILNKCSRHRSKFKPVDDTPPGYWDLTFPPSLE